jgi:hypothetical protein
MFRGLESILKSKQSLAALFLQIEGLQYNYLQRGWTFIAYLTTPPVALPV